MRRRLAIILGVLAIGVVAAPFTAGAAINWINVRQANFTLKPGGVAHSHWVFSKVTKVGFRLIRNGGKPSRLKVKYTFRCSGVTGAASGTRIMYPPSKIWYNGVVRGGKPVQSARCRIDLVVTNPQKTPAKFGIVYKRTLH